ALYTVRAVADGSTPKAKLETILAEAHAASLLSHPKIVRVREVIAEDDTTWVASDFLAGEPLAQLLHNVQGGLHRTIAAALAKRIAIMLHEAHVARDRRGTPIRTHHGDLSPANIVFTHEGEVFLSDFGVEDATHRASAQQLAYRAPERIQN